MADCKELSISFAYLSTHWHALTHAKDPIQLSSSSCYVLLSQYPLLSLTNSRTSYSENTKVFDSREVREVQEGATCFCARKLSKFG